MPIHLDSLVAYARYQSALESGEQGEIRDLICQLPLSKMTKDDLWVWQASALMFEGVSSAGMRRWTRKTVIPHDYATRLADGVIERGRKPTGLVAEAKVKNSAALRDKNGEPKLYAQKIDVVRGDMYNNLEAYPVRYAKKAIAYCIGDADKLEMLLNPEMGFLTAIGKRVRLGHGKISGFHIIEDDAALELWGRRILPWEKEGYLGIEANVIPPYWDAKGRVTAWAHPDVF